MKVELRNSETDEVLATFSEESEVEDDAMLRIVVSRPDGELISFEEDKTGWLQNLPKALATSSRLYAVVVPE